jgi:pyrroline-5-carboxylate reductase
MKNKKICIIGAGNLGLSIAQGLVNKGFDKSEIVLTKRTTVKHTQGFKYTVNNKVAAKCDIIIICLQPGQVENVINEIKEVITEKHIIISCAAGISILQIEKYIGRKISIVRAMPNTAVTVGESMTCFCLNAEAEKELKTIESIFNSLGKSIRVKEELMQAATVICASGVAFWMRFIRATMQGAVQLGFEAQEARYIATQTCLGSAMLLMHNGSHPEQEIDKVTTPRGCTISGLNEMEHNGLSSALIKGLVSSYNKLAAIERFL